MHASFLKEALFLLSCLGEASSYPGRSMKTASKQSKTGTLVVMMK